MKITSKLPIAMAQAPQTPQGDTYAIALKPVIYLPSLKPDADWTDISHDQKISIAFRINLEKRDWGIKGISMSLIPANLSLELYVVELKGERETEFSRIVQFDPSKIELRQEPGNEVTITGLTIQLHDDFTVDYAQSYFDGTTLMGN